MYEGLDDCNENYSENHFDESENEELDDQFDEDISDTDFDELEDFADPVREIIEHNQRQIRFADHELSEVEKSAFWEKNIIDVKNVINRVKELLERRQDILERLSEMNPGSAKAWALEDEQRNRELKLKQQLTLAQAGIEGNTLYDTVDEASHLIVDSYDSDNRELRKSIKDDLKNMSYRGRERMIEQLLEDGRIDQSQYNYLKSEFF